MLALAQSGPFRILALASAAAGVCVALASVARRRRMEGPITLSAALALLIGMAGTGFGLQTAANAIAASALEPNEELRIFVCATGVAWSTTGFGALGAAVDLLALGLASLFLRERAESLQHRTRGVVDARSRTPLDPPVDLVLSASGIDYPRGGRLLRVTSPVQEESRSFFPARTSPADTKPSASWAAVVSGPFGSPGTCTKTACMPSRCCTPTPSPASVDSRSRAGRWRYSAIQTSSR